MYNKNLDKMDNFDLKKYLTENKLNKDNQMDDDAFVEKFKEVLRDVVEKYNNISSSTSFFSKSLSIIFNEILEEFTY
jgi:hypothetical protein